MHNLYTIFVRFLRICKQLGENLINEKGDIPLCGFVHRFSDIEAMDLNLTAKTLTIDSESYLFAKISECKKQFLI